MQSSGPRRPSTLSTSVPGQSGGPARCPLPSPLAGMPTQSHLLPVSHAGKWRPVPLKRRLALGRSSWYPKETLVSCILVLASNSTPTCSWRGQGDTRGSASQAQLSGMPAPGTPHPARVPARPVPGPAHLVTGFVVVCCMHARLTQRDCRQPVVHCKRAGWGGAGYQGSSASGNPGFPPSPSEPGVQGPRLLLPQTQESRVPRLTCVFPS